MKKVILKSSLLLFMSFLFTLSYAQTRISGTIINSETGEAVPYAYIKKKSTNRGAITNEDGYFELVCNEGDVLMVSFVSFENKEIPYQYFESNQELKLSPSSNQLETVQVFADFDFLYALFEDARKNLRQSEKQKSKTYFSLETSARGIPIELLECYYNAEVGPSGINELSLKNGRIGMSKLDDTYFANLYTTQIISDYRLLNKAENQFAINPLQLSKKRLRKLYNMKLIGFQSNVYHVQFIPKDTITHFISEVWIAKEKKQFSQIKLRQKKMEKHPFQAIDKKHKMEDLNFEIIYTFSDGAQSSLDKIAFKYDFDYDNNKTERNISSSGVFLFFDKETEFDLPYYSETGHELSDYDKIVSQPYNENFWKFNTVLSPSRRSVLYKEYFKKTGVLLNFDELSKYNDLFRNKLVEWSKNRVLLNEINQAGNFKVSTSYYHNRAKVLTQFYNFEVQIYLDRNIQEDSTYYLSKTLINLEESFYYLAVNENTDCFINLYFDMVELERRWMMDVISRKDWSKEQVDSIYLNSQETLKDNMKFFLSEIERGENKNVVDKYIKVAEANLGVDNALLIWSEEMMQKLDNGEVDSQEAWISYYNQGTALLTLNKFKESLPFLLAAYEMGSRDPWLYYNLGLNYLKLGEFEKGCQFLTESRMLGEAVNEELTSECD